MSEAGAALGGTKAPAPSVRLRPHRTLWQDAARRFMHNRLAVFGLGIVLFFFFLAIFADVLAPHPYDKVYFDKVLLFPFKDPAFPLGTDEVGRDYLSRLIYGARTSMTVGMSVQLVALLIGLPLGGLAGYLGGKVDFAISRLIDIMTAFPGLLFAILVITVLGGGMWKVIMALSITSWIGIARLTRGQILALREKEYIEAARSIGAPRLHIISRHLLPNALSPILIAVSFGVPAAIFGEAGLSFLGIGINDPIASWGKMVGVSNAYVRVYWHLALFPTLLIALSMLGFSFVGDGLRDALDPRTLE
ncbi:MAG: ABC transporter permease [Caldilineae bacterium]|nr:MAG: ABC transporter permease [Caldilineae bacterium]